jgi:molybdenum cofactor cytidylyltransferase
VKKGPIAGIVLAAGEARRFGGCKQLAKLRGKPLLQWVLDAALASDLDAVILVLGSRHREVRSVLEPNLAHPRLQVVVNPDFASGRSTSLKAGLQRVCDEFGAAMFLLGDQPLITSSLVNRLLKRFRASNRLIVAPVCRRCQGNPCIFDRALFQDILQTAGDLGGRSVIAAHPDHVLRVEIDHPDFFFDVDTPGDLVRLQARLESPPRKLKPEC